MTHRDFVKLAFEPFINKYKVNMAAEPSMLDVGCGNKSLRPYFEGKGFKWFGLEIEDHGKELLKYKMEDMNGIPDEQYDLVFSCHSFEHCERPIDALNEFKRVCKPGGYLFIATPSPCHKQILNADEDHIFVLNNMQMERLLKYVEFSEVHTYLQTEDIKEEQNYNVISYGRKDKEDNIIV